MSKMLVVTLTLGGLLAGCALSQPVATADQEPAGSTVTIGLSGDPEGLHPLVWPRATSEQIFQVVFGGLVRPNENLEYEPYLARSWSISEDNRTITFFLRDDVKWHDGVPFTASDVAFSLNAIAHPDHPGGVWTVVDRIEGVGAVQRGEAENISGVQVLDDHTIAITYEVPYAPFLYRMAFHVVPEHILGEQPVSEWERSPFNQHPVGIGPFRVEEYRPDEHVKLEAFQDYFLGAPQFDTLIYRIGSPGSLVAQFISGEVDIIEVPVQELPTVEQLSFAAIREHPGPRYLYMAFNVADEKFQDPQVRRAMWYSIHREQIVDGLLGGQGTPIYCLTPPDRWEYNHELVTPFDPEEAQRILDEAGWPKDPDKGIRQREGVELQFELWYPTDREGVIPYVAAVIQQNLQGIGLEVLLRVVDSPSLWSQLFPRDATGAPRAVGPEEFDAVLVSLGGSGDPTYLRSELHSHCVAGGGNYTNYVNEAADRLLDLQAVTLGFQERQSVFHELFALLRDDPARIPIVVPNVIFAYHTRISGFSPAANSRTNRIMHWSVAN